MNKKETMILVIIFVIGLCIFTLYKLGYIRFYMSNDSVYAQIEEINEDYILLKSLKKSGGIEKSEKIYLEVPGNIDALKTGDKLKFVPSKIDESNPRKVYTDSIKLIK